MLTGDPAPGGRGEGGEDGGPVLHDEPAGGGGGGAHQPSADPSNVLYAATIGYYGLLALSTCQLIAGDCLAVEGGAQADMMPLPHLIEPVEEAVEVVVVSHSVVEEGVAPHPTKEAEGDEERTGLHPVGPRHLAVGAEDEASTGEALCLPAASSTYEMVLSAWTGNIFPTGHAGCPKVNLDGRVNGHHVDQDFWRTIGTVPVQTNCPDLRVDIKVHLNTSIRTLDHPAQLWFSILRLNRGKVFNAFIMIFMGFAI